MEIYHILFSFFINKWVTLHWLNAIHGSFATSIITIMILQKISIFNYKNIESAELSFSPNINCFVGHNGMGKTNMLDAIYYLSFCKSAYSNIDSLNIKHDADFFVVEGTYTDENDNMDVVYAGMKRGSKKHFKRNKKEYKRFSQHIGLVPLVFVSPSDSLLVEGGSEERRRLMDMVIAQCDITYIEALNKYNKALQQRNALLKQEDEPDVMLMEILEEEMALQGEIIYAKRAAFVNELVPIFQSVYQRISGNSEQVSLEYISHCQRGPLLDVIRRDRFKDRAVGYSLHGIHRDDLEMKLGGYMMKREGSQGQTKTFVIALKLAQFDILRRTAAKTTPLLLLDDIFDKLDAKRVEEIVKLVSGDSYGQIFITDTNRDHLDKILQHSVLDYKLFDVADGIIKEKKEEQDV